ncbi:hypothetical protein Mal4_04930 [Maioricimonas rarisocia]|uniref:PSP1 C-terminal domain-containing protein n=1 Tax=Maioricimonas rarisocia TaxID=2528026 RepID=A0A517Z1B2_9PLAN|nr:PSP1 C-terminal domain-containing protein [Maioricimonas rarisocia]QDU36209.1 hypothetical protein Mal4_04930 [Maioricimonas rarisocia]
MIALVRYGVIPEVARCEVPESLAIQRGDRVVIQTHRGLVLGTVLDQVKVSPEPGESGPPAPSSTVVRLATADDERGEQDLKSEAAAAFAEWNERIHSWKLDLQLIDLEWTLDRGKQVLYVLNDRGPDCTTLALRAAAAGLGVIEVQPVSSEGVVTLPSGGGGGCGSCGSGH